MIIDQLTAIPSPQGTDELPIERGTLTYKITYGDLIGDAVGDVSTLSGFTATDLTGAANELKTDLNTLDGKVDTVKSDIGIVEDTDTATHTIAAGQYVIWKDALYVASTAIPLGTTLSLSNLTAVSNGGLNDLMPEYGSTANGNYIKFSDGTLICWGESGIVSVSGNSTGSVNVTFPVSFTGEPVAFANLMSSLPTQRSATVQARTASGMTVYFQNATGASVSVYAQWLAIGRWK